MRTKAQVVCFLFSAILFVLPGSAANPIKDPKRIVNGRAVDLTPLFHWWNEHDGNRPLPAWVRVTGQVIGTNAWGWIVQAKIEHQPVSQGRPSKVPPETHEEIVLKNPPMQEKAEYEALQAQLKALNEQRGLYAQPETHVKNELQEIHREQKTLRNEHVRARGYGQAEKVARAQEKQIQTHTKPLDKEIAELKKRLSTYPDPDHFVLDCVALETGQENGKLPVFDMGIPVR